MIRSAKMKVKSGIQKTTRAGKNHDILPQAYPSFQCMKKMLSMMFIAITLTACSTNPENPVPTNDESISEPTASILEIPSAETADQVYTLDTSASVLTWEASRLAATPHVGTVAIQSGALFETNGSFTGGEFVIDMTQITEEKNNERFLNHIKNEDFFGVDQYPTSKLVLTSVVKKSDQSYDLTGNLTIRDQTHPISFSAQIEPKENQWLATSEFQIDRTKWGIVYDSGSFFMELGDRAIKDEITYRLDLTFQK